MDFDNIVYIVGQFLSVLAVIIGFISFQMKTPKSMLVFQMAASLIFSAHYLLIGAMTAMALNLLAVIKFVCYYIRDRRSKKGLFEPILFTVLVIITSLITWDSWYSVFIMIGLVINSISFALSNAQLIRKFNLIKAPLCLVYNIAVFSTGGIFYETFTFVSSIIGIFFSSKNNIKNKTCR